MTSWLTAHCSLRSLLPPWTWRHWDRSTALAQTPVWHSLLSRSNFFPCLSSQLFLVKKSLGQCIPLCISTGMFWHSFWHDVFDFQVARQQMTILKCCVFCSEDLPKIAQLSSPFAKPHLWVIQKLNASACSNETKNEERVGETTVATVNLNQPGLK